ncbi:hypothetical protein [Longimicrobium terrae]|uniref:STAS/SEC14 domain-containing protein n=2 Tax=Longimicrobium terrae TaxID=1639882 RepID=A0A841H6M9_9BACT|nr:hypothetical protein [Longimicrobium terrae]MBB4639326.1 hypothetical protein [Longimicrobium terrae]MBB6073603.1 hypothetical protein [Longimicrobium terrae]NNC29390.1 hypothetical protein [Longimicrobium terrae]
MSRFTWIEHKGTRILFGDFREVTRSDDLTAMIEEGKRVVKNQPPNSLLSLLDVTGLRFTVETARLLKEGMAHNTPFVKATGIIGLSGLQKVLFQAIRRIRGVTIESFATREEAMDWLITKR